MSTNYYMIITDKNLVEKYFPDEYRIVDKPYWGYEIHIGKRSYGWCPIFERHNKAYKSVKEMIEFLSRYHDVIGIYDEYGTEISIKELQEELIDWKEHQEIRYMKYVPKGVPDELFGGTKYFIEGTKDDYDITIPYDHIEYVKLNPFDDISNYYRDEDGYVFIEGEFC
uniref:Uncharacterized protein n=1 Tax=Siphoviridae sp. ctXZx16 TaxID=2826371 RepID=A0A8S5MKM7_9CAUD|nr:MAG TPA: hypothetical protein [Siphoviridae sp. ctXZx16]